MKTVSKGTIQKTAEATGDLIGNKISDDISVSKESAKELQNNESEVDVKRVTPKKRYISPEERQQIIDELRLVPKKRCIFLKIIDKLMLKLKNIHISRRKTTNY